MKSVRHAVCLILACLFLPLPFPAAVGQADSGFLGFSLAPLYEDAGALCAALDGAIQRGEAAFVCRVPRAALVDAASDHLRVRGVSHSLTAATLPDGTTGLDLEMTVPIGQRVAYAHETGRTDTLLDARGRQVREAALAVLEGVLRPDMAARERVWAIHDYLAGHVLYAAHAEDSDAYGALCLGRAVCGGFADAFYLLASMAGLEVARVPGTADGEGHVWNAVCLDGAWYFVDVTWDALPDGGVSHAHLLMPPDMFTRHTWDTSNVPGEAARQLDASSYMAAHGLLANTPEALLVLALRAYAPGAAVEALCPAPLDVASAAQEALQALVETTSGSGGSVSYAVTPLGAWQHVTLRFELDALQ